MLFRAPWDRARSSSWTFLLCRAAPGKRMYVETFNRLRKNYFVAARDPTVRKSGAIEYDPAGCSKRPFNKTAASEETKRTNFVR